MEIGLLSLRLLLFASYDRSNAEGMCTILEVGSRLIATPVQTLNRPQRCHKILETERGFIMSAKQNWESSSTGGDMNRV